MVDWSWSGVHDLTHLLILTRPVRSALFPSFNLCVSLSRLTLITATPPTLFTKGQSNVQFEVSGNCRAVKLVLRGFNYIF